MRLHVLYFYNEERVFISISLFSVCTLLHFIGIGPQAYIFLKELLSLYADISKSAVAQYETVHYAEASVHNILPLLICKGHDLVMKTPFAGKNPRLCCLVRKNVGFSLGGGVVCSVCFKHFSL